MARKTYWLVKTVLCLSLVLVFATGFLIFSTVYASGDRGKKERIVGEITQFLKEKRVALSERRQKAMAETIYTESEKYDVDYRLVLAIIKVESNFRPHVTARDGSRGLMQLQPSLARGIARKNGEPYKNANALNEPETNIRYGTYHIGHLVKNYENLNAALHVYNAGVRNARRRLKEEGTPDTPFTRKVLAEYSLLMKILTDPYEEVQ